jgi:hypothetical protein
MGFVHRGLLRWDGEGVAQRVYIRSSTPATSEADADL